MLLATYKCVLDWPVSHAFVTKPRSSGTKTKPPLCKWEKICKQIGAVRRDGGIVLLIFTRVQSLSRLRRQLPLHKGAFRCGGIAQSESSLEPPALLVVFGLQIKKPIFRVVEKSAFAFKVFIGTGKEAYPLPSRHRAWSHQRQAPW